MPVNNESVFPVYSAALIFTRISSHIFSIFSISGCELSPTVSLWILSSNFCFHRLPHLGDFPLLCICINVWQRKFLIDSIMIDKRINLGFIIFQHLWEPVQDTLVDICWLRFERHITWSWGLRMMSSAQQLMTYIIRNPWIRCSLSAFQMALGFASRVVRSFLMSLLKSKPRCLAWREESFSHTLILRRCILGSLSIPISSRCHFWLSQC